MFLDGLLRRKPAFVEAAVVLHRQGQLPANCYVLDLDAVTRNARLFSAEAGRLGMKIFAMTKRAGRVQKLLAHIQTKGDTFYRGDEGGFDAVDIAEVVGSEPTSARSALRSVEIPPFEAIDYYRMIDADGPGAPQVGDSVVFGFRGQAFVTRALIAVCPASLTASRASRQLRTSLASPKHGPTCDE